MAKNKNFSVQNSFTFGNFNQSVPQEPDISSEPAKNELNPVTNENDNIYKKQDDKTIVQNSLDSQDSIQKEQESNLNSKSEPFNNVSQAVENHSGQLHSEQNHVVNNSEFPDDGSKVSDSSKDNNTSKEALKEKVKIYMKEPIKKTSITIQRSSLNFLAYSSKVEGLNQPEYLTLLLLEEMDKPVAQPDFNSVAEKRNTIGTITKGIQLPESICNWAKKRSALEMKNMSEYIDDLLQSHIQQSI